jgi:hypothetical protein
MVMENQDPGLTPLDIEQLLAALDQIEQFTWLARNALLKAAPAGRIPGGPPCGLKSLVDSGKTDCAREYAVKAGGAPCVDKARQWIPPAEGK